MKRDARRHRSSLPFVLAALLSAGCYVEVEDETILDEEAAEAETELAEGVEAPPPKVDAAHTSERALPGDEENPLEFDLHSEPVPEPWQGKGEEK